MVLLGIPFLVYFVVFIPCVLYAALLAWKASKEIVYAYYVLHTIAAIISHGSILCIAIVYVVKFVNFLPLASQCPFGEMVQVTLFLLVV